jgi:hypothetical protein
MTMDDGGWGAIASNFANALSTDALKQSQIYVHGAQYKKLLLDAEEKKRQMDAVKASIDNYPSLVPTFPEGPAAPGRQAQLDAVRKQQILDNAASSNLAKSAEDYTKGVFGTRAAASIAGGIPQSQSQQDVIQTYLSGSGMSLPNYAATPHTYQPMDASGSPVGAPITSRRMPEGPAALASPVKPGPTNPFENAASADQRLLAMSQKAQADLAAGRPSTLTQAEVEEAAVHLQNRHGVKIAQGKGADGATTLTATRENPYPEQYNPLVEEVAKLNWWRAERAAAAREGRPMATAMPAFVPPAALPPPDARTGGLVGAPVAPAAAAPGAAAPPPVAPPTVGGLPVGANAAAPVQIAAGDATPLRKEFTDLYPVKNYYQAVTPYKQFVANIKVGTPQADVAMIYNLAKMLDPQSVVREGEMVIWSKAGGPFERVKGLIDNLTASKAKLTPDIRAKLADMGERVMSEYHGAFKDAADHYTELAQSYGIPPEKVVPKVPDDILRIDRKTISSITPAGPGPKGAPEKSSLTTAPAAAPAGARPSGRTIRVRPDGTIEDVP